MAKTTKKKAVKEAPKKEAYKYTVIVKTKGEVFKEETNDIADALLGFGITSTNTTTEITVKSGKKEVTRLFMVYKARRIFSNKITAQSVANSITFLLDGE